MKWVRTLLVAVPAAAFPILALAALAEASQNDKIKLSDFLFDLTKANSVLQADSAKVEASWGKIESYSGLLPTLKLGFNRLIDKQYMLIDIPAAGGGTTTFSQVLPSTNYSLNAQWPIFDGLARFDRIRAAGLLDEAAKDDSEWMRFKIKREGVLLYYRAVAAKILREVAEQNVRMLRDHLNDARLFKKSGVATNFDLLRVEVKLTEAEAEVANAADTEALSILKLGELANASYEGRQIDGQLPVLDVKIVETAALTVNSRKDLRSQAQKSDALEETARASSRHWLPRASLYAQFDRYNNRSEAVDFNSDAFRDAHSIGVQLSWTIFDGLAPTAQAHQADERVRQARYQLATQQNRAKIDLELWRRKFKYFSAVYRARIEEVEKATESVRLAKEGRKVGVRTNSDLLDAEGELFHARAGVVHAQMGAIEALINLELSSGRELQGFN